MLEPAIKYKEQLEKTVQKKAHYDKKLQTELSNYDSAIVEELRSVNCEIATYEERVASILKLQSMPRAINELEKNAGASSG